MQDTRPREGMGRLPDQALRELASLDDYDRTLAYDRLGRMHSMSAEQVAAEYQAYLSGGDAGAMADPNAVTERQGEEQDASVVGRAQYIEDAHRYRLRYDPSREAAQRQAGVEQAVVCPLCMAPLGIPSVRPIKVECPNCGGEAIFTA